MDLLPSVITRPVGRLGAAAQNALEIARFGGLQTEQARSPYRVLAEDPISRLRRYYPLAAEAAAAGQGGPGAPILLVPPMMLAAEIYDVSPSTSAVTLLHDRGVDPWVVDFGSPEHEQGGLERTLADHVVAVSDAVDRVRELTGSDVHLGGYSQGGMFCYQVAAYRNNAGLASLITFGSPVDTRLGMPFGVPEQFASQLASLLADRVFGASPLPAWASRFAFQMIDPVKSARNRVEFLMQLHDREALLEREGQRRFLEADGWVAWPGPAMADFLRQFIAHNRLLEGGFAVRDRLLTLADLQLPILSVVGTVDEIAPAAGVRAIRAAAPRADVFELALDSGHFGLVVGSTANQTTWPAVAGWIGWRERRAGRAAQGIAPAVDEPAPDAITEIPDDPSAADASDPAHPSARNRLDYGVELAGGVGGGIVRTAAGAALRSAQGVVGLSREAAGQLPRLARLEQIGARTRVSLGLLIDERARRASDEILFVFGDRAHTAGEVNTRIDNVVKGLIAIGVRQGEHVGVLMSSRPTAFALVAALSRLGAVAVMLRPDGDTAREAALGRVQRIVADPERAAQAAGLSTVHTFVLGMGGRDQTPAVESTTDMEQIDVGGVRLPRWYRPNPGRATDLAFVMFTGEDSAVRLSRITNGRWATSALGTASSAALSSADTVYSVTPLYHPSGLMTAVGGAVAGGARLALASAFDPDAFWDEVRRYGATVVSYTWTMLHSLVDVPPQPGERHHPIRLFIGSGMPRGLWRRVQQRFAPARVVEFYASTETGAILVNLRGTKPGALGRPLPGSPAVRLAAYDVATDQLVLGQGGFVRECRPEEPGMLLARSREQDSVATTPLRGVFGRDDAWLSTGDLFRRDRDGDFWRLDSARDALLTARGVVYSGVVRDALGDLDAIDMAVVYGLRPGRRRTDLAVAAVTLRPGAALDARALSAGLTALPAGERPDLVHVVDAIPVTTWFRPVTAPLRAQPLPDAGGVPARAWYLDAGGERYRPLTESARRRLSARDAR